MGIFSFLFNKKSNNLQSYLDKDYVVLDVRTPAEFNAGNIENCVHIPLSELQQRITEIKDLNTPVIAYCARGIRSNKAVAILKNNNIEAVNGGGIKQLQAALRN